MQPSTRSIGAVATLTFSAGMNLTAGHIGTRMRYIGRQILITAVASNVSATATIEESLPASQILGFAAASDPANFFTIGDVVQGTVTNSRAIVTAINSGAQQITVQLLTLTTTEIPGRSGTTVQAFTTADTVVGPGGSLAVLGVTSVGNPQPVTIWDDEVMNTLRGWPASCFFDQNRLGFCNFPSVPRGVGWSAIGLPNDLYVDAQPANAIFELVPQKCQVYDVVAGQEGSEFVFTDKGVRYIPISETNPLKPGSVAFKFVSWDTCSSVQPRSVQDLILYFTASLNQVMAVVSGGDVSRPHATRDLSELRSHLFNAPIAIAAPTSPGQFPERYIYVLNGDGTVVVGRMPTVDGQINSQGIVGWVPWVGAGFVRWISALGSSVIFSSGYGVTPMIERLDNTLYLDSVIPVNAVPIGLTPPAGKGPLWWFNTITVDLMDQGTRMMGTYHVDANGFIVPQNNGGEDLTSPSLVAGQAWTATLEPFIPPAQAGQDISQRMDPRQIVKAEVYVKNSTGFLMATLYSGQSGPNLPAQGTVMRERRSPAWDQGEDATLLPPLREQSYQDVPIGRAHDPRWAVIKDTPGPIEVLEIATRVSV
jgi:hypothetical protein